MSDDGRVPVFTREEARSIAAEAIAAYKAVEEAESRGGMVDIAIGSRVVESACKNVVAARMKQSGMMWTLDGPKDMLQLRASVKSRRFWSDFENLLPSLPPQQTDEIHLEAA